MGSVASPVLVMPNQMFFELIKSYERREEGEERQKGRREPKPNEWVGINGHKPRVRHQRGNETRAQRRRR